MPNDSLPGQRIQLIGRIRIKYCDRRELRRSQRVGGYQQVAVKSGYASADADSEGALSAAEEGQIA